VGGVLAIDLGTKKSGFAYADALRIAVRPLETRRGDEAATAAEIARLLDEYDVDTLLVGLPRNMDGSEGPRAQASHAFAERLRARFPGCAVVLHDESLTTKEAESRLREAGYRRNEIRQRKDSWSAWVLLDDWLRSGEPR